MKITSAHLDSLRVGFKTNFQNAFSAAPTDYAKIATIIMSSSKEEKYGWLGTFPKVRGWFGDRQVQNLKEHSYAIVNRDFEETVDVDRNDIEDDNLGLYAPMFQMLGQSVGTFPDELVFGILKAGFSSLCYDGQNFFDTDHPVVNEAGATVSVANTDGGSGAPWFLLCTTGPLKPVILQKRKEWEFVAKDDTRDDNVFMRKKYVYGVDGRMNVGYGFWQQAWGSKQTLNAANYAAARAAILSMKGDGGVPLGLVPNLLVVPPSLEGAARKIVASQLVNGGETNEWAGTAEVLMTPWLA